MSGVATKVGYVVVPLLSEKDKFNSTILLDSSYFSFAPTAREAWARRIGASMTDVDFSKKVQIMFDKGYRVKDATLTIEL